MFSLAQSRSSATLARGYAFAVARAWRRDVLITFASATILTGCMHSAGAPSNLDFSRTRASEHGIYRAEIVPEDDSIPQGKGRHSTVRFAAEFRVRSLPDNAGRSLS